MGSSISSNPTYLYQTPSGYIFRIRIPQDLRTVVGRTEFRYSLRSGSLRIAKHRARCMASFVQQLFYEVRNTVAEYTPEKIIEAVKQGADGIIHERKGIDSSSPQIWSDGKVVNTPSCLTPSDGTVLLSPEEIKSIVIRYLRETLDNDEKCRALACNGATTLDGLSLLEASSMGAEEAQSILKSVTRWLRNGDHSFVHSLTGSLLRREGVSTDQQSETFKILSRELMRAFQSVLHVRMKRAVGDYSQADEELIPAIKEAPVRAVADTVIAPVAPAVEVESTPFTKIIEKYIAETEKGENWTEKTTFENRAIFELFTRVMGDLPIESIDRKLMVSFKDTLMKLPPNMNKKKEFAGLTIQEIMDTKPDKTISVNTLNKYLRRLGGAFNWAVRNGYMQSNPASDLQIKRQKRADQERQAYTNEDLDKLFNSKEYREDKHRETYCYWTPLIALYTGCRLEERGGGL